MRDVLRGRAIVIFPALPEPDPLVELRARFDPLVDLIPAHITLVFPFESDLSPDELCAHVERSVRGIGAFPIRLSGITGMEDKYLFLNVKRGNDTLIELHDRLYSGPLQSYLSLAFTFIPHVTVGRFTSHEAFVNALASASALAISIDTEVRTICIYNAAVAGAHALESEVPLAGW
jgi:2'-5' RNA ligase